MKRLRAALEAGEFVVTTEFEPPKGTDLSGFRRKARQLAGVVHAANVTDNQSARMRMSPLGGALALLEEGVDPILQLTGRDRNRLALQSDLLAASAFGVRQVLALSGDPIAIGDHPDARPVNEVDSTGLVELIATLNSGRDARGNPLTGATDLWPGAAVAPDNPDPAKIEAQVEGFVKKVRAGARFFQTQAVYSPERLAAFMARPEVKGSGARVLAGLVVLKSAKMARYMNEKVPGIFVPEPLIGELERAADPVAKGLEVAARQIRELRGLCHGVHLMTLGLEERVPEILELARL
ncbi:MAG TPA: methylenetetrahydrofolate reductase [Thermodesulfobacteriota bacterium]|nr:methylenetetrahydrofolate reductase [Thermodesulfobacteriota bacterium]